MSYDEIGPAHPKYSQIQEVSATGEPTMNTRIPEGTTMASLQAQVDTLLHVVQTGHFPYHTVRFSVLGPGPGMTQRLSPAECTDDRCPANTWARLSELQ